MEKINIAVVGATGAVGKMMLRVLEQRSFPVDRLYPLASKRSAGNIVQFKDQACKVGLLDDLILPAQPSRYFPQVLRFRKPMRRVRQKLAIS